MPQLVDRNFIVFFQTGSHALDASARRVLDEAAAVARTGWRPRIQVAGRSDTAPLPARRIDQGGTCWRWTLACPPRSPPAKAICWDGTGSSACGPMTPGSPPPPATSDAQAKGPGDSRRYRAAVADLRGFIRTEVGRVLNRPVAAKRPAALVLERLDLRNPTLFASPEPPAAKLRALGDPGETDRPARPLRRRGQGGQLRLHVADLLVHAARDIGRRRASPIGSVFQRKDAILEEVVRAFLRRKVRALRSGRTGATGRDADGGCSADPRLANPYFGRRRPVTVRTSPTPPALAAA